jgi:hypothetical protein
VSLQASGEAGRPKLSALRKLFERALEKENVPTPVAFQKKQVERRPTSRQSLKPTVPEDENEAAPAPAPSSPSALVPAAEAASKDEFLPPPPPPEGLPQWGSEAPLRPPQVCG